MVGFGTLNFGGSIASRKSPSAVFHRHQTACSSLTPLFSALSPASRHVTGALLSASGDYVMPPDGPRKAYLEYIEVSRPCLRLILAEGCCYTIAS